MPLSPVSPFAPGGILHLEYSNVVAGERHSLHLHVCHFNPTALGSTHDRAYVSGGPVTPSETHLSATYDAWADLWATYYDADWLLRCEGLYIWQPGRYTVLSPAPDFPVRVGASTSDDPGWPRFDRRFRLLGQRAEKRHLHLCQVPGTEHRPAPFDVSPTTGGVDSRDRALLGYLSGAGGGGVVMPDGTYCFPVTTMQVLWARSVAALGSSAPGSPYVVTG